MTASYYTGLPTIVAPGKDTQALEKAILAVWSQQWPRLRAEFSFRTAVMSGRRLKNNFAVQVSASAVADTRPHGNWVEAAAWDATSVAVTPLRRFLWRYGRDMAFPRTRFRELVDLFLIAEQRDELPLRVAQHVTEAMPELADGEVLKRDILGIRTMSLPLCPPVSLPNMLSLIDDDRWRPLIGSADIKRRLEATSASDIALAANIIGERPQYFEHWPEVLDGIAERADEQLLDQNIPSRMMVEILRRRGDLVQAQSVKSLRSEDLMLLFDCHADYAIRNRLVLEALQRVFAPELLKLLSHECERFIFIAIGAHRSNRLDQSWIAPISGAREIILASQFVNRISSLGDVCTAIYLLGLWNGASGLNRDASFWANALPRLRPDASELDVLFLYASLLILALDERSPASWKLIELTLPTVRAGVLRGQLPNNVYSLLDRAVPSIRDNWDLNKRILMALHRLYETNPATRQELGRAGVWDDDLDIVFYGMPEPPRQRLFWWLP
ncbi:hypothetical protein [Bradyrhizobium sp. S3.5.5]|uniref:hypothetical protein n=1 Tax=Bradyrhizobium sp. S3.5.5 TaxID=3156430 RepID=UPI003397B9ED